MREIPEKYIIQETLRGICANKLFEKSPRNLRLLNFLVQNALEGNDIKEQVIGLELFEKNYDPEKNDAKVRVYMFNLRKKLEEYYTNDGADDPVKFKIEKGQYNLSFESAGEDSGLNSTDKTIPVKSFFKLRNLLVALFLIVLVGAGIIWEVSTRANYCWDTFFDSKFQNFCVVSDHFMIEEQQQNGLWYARHVYGINNDKDLIKYSNDNEDETVRATDYTIFTKMAPLSIYNLTKWFVKNNSDFSVRLESELRYEETKNNNILFVGQFKTMNTSKVVFLRGSKNFSVIRNGFKYHNSELDTSYVSNFENKIRTEYSIVSYMPMENGNKALFFTSNNDIGVIATVRYFTNLEWLAGFYKNLPGESAHFNALFKVTGLDRSDMSCELLHLEVIEE